MNMELLNLSFQAGSVFTPGAPINERNLFAGRIAQIRQIMGAISQTGYHAVLYGERGVGKTSLANVLEGFLKDVMADRRFLIVRINCDASDTFTSIWLKALRDITVTKIENGIGFNSNETATAESIVRQLPNPIAPDDIRRLLSSPMFQNVSFVVVFDEFDRLQDNTVTSLMADTIKTLSDYSIATTILVIGVADSVDALIHEHQSIERALVQIPMPRMSSTEIAEIITNGLSKLTMTIDPNALDEIITLTQGIPYIAHLLGLHSARNCLDRGNKNIEIADIENAMELTLNLWHQSIKSAYYDAVSSNQPDTIHREVLLACALAKTDEMGYFVPSSVRTPLSIITGKKYDIPGYAKHLKNFSTDGRGNILTRYAEDGRRYRFTSPLMRPYIVMRGFVDSAIDKDKLNQIEAANLV